MHDKPVPLGARTFQAGRFWSTNVFAAMVAGIGGGILMFVVMCIVVSLNPTRDNLLFAGALILFLIVTVICTFYGNLIAAYPYAVTLEVGKGLQLYAPLKMVYIPTNDLRDVQRSALQSGYVVRLNRRHRLLTGFLVPAFFGDQAEPLAEAIRTEIEENRS